MRFIFEYTFQKYLLQSMNIFERCNRTCTLGISILGAINKDCWLCFEEGVRLNPSCINYSVRKISAEKKMPKKYVELLDENGNTIYSNETNNRTMMDILASKSELSDFTYKSLKYMIRHNAKKSEDINLLFLWKHFGESIDEGYRYSKHTIDYQYYNLIKVYHQRFFKLLYIALENGWYMPFPSGGIVYNPYIDSWLACLSSYLSFIALDDIRGEKYFRKLVWIFLERGEDITKDRKRRMKKNMENYKFPYMYLEIKKEILLKNPGCSGVYQDFAYSEIKKIAIKEFIKKMDMYASEYYLQECMKEL